MIKKILFLSSIFLSINYQPVMADDTIAVFKNGNAFFIKDINSEVKNNSILLNDIPNAVFGTIWFSSKNDSIKSVNTTEQFISNKVGAGNIADILSSNISKKVKIYFTTGESLEGKIEKIQSDLIFLRSKTSLSSFNITSIKMIDFIDEPNYELNKTENRRVIKIEFNKPDPKNIQMSYLQKNIGWLPSYYIDLQNSDKAKITLTSTIINDAEDIKNSNVKLVVGSANFAYSHLLSPLTSTQVLNDFLNNLENSSERRHINRNNLSNIMTQQSSTSYEPVQTSTYFEEEKISQQEDFYFYEIPSLTLKKNSRALFNIFKSEVKYEHIYDVELDSNLSLDIYSNNTSKVLPKVWHSISLNNTTGFPFTTGTAMVTKTVNNQVMPISQDKLNYTPINGKTKLKLTVAPDVSVEELEKEISRTENIKLKDNSYYDMVTIESRINIKNSKNNNIKLLVNRLVEGELQNSNYNWNPKTLNVYKIQNKTNQIEWTLDLKSGESKEIIYKYNRYFRK